MLYSPHIYPYNYRIAQPAEAHIRILHASPDAPAVDVYANDKLISSNLTYRSFTPYVNVAPGRYNIKVYPVGRKDNAVLSAELDIPANSIYTIAAINRLANLALNPIREPRIPIPQGKVYVRFVHLSPNAPNVDVVLQNGTKIFRNVGYKQATDYAPFNPSTYTIYVRPTGIEQNILYVPNITLQPNRFYSIYLVGFVGDTPSLQALIPLDGNTYIK